MLDAALLEFSALQACNPEDIRPDLTAAITHDPSAVSSFCLVSQWLPILNNLPDLQSYPLIETVFALNRTVCLHPFIFPCMPDPNAFFFFLQNGPLLIADCLDRHRPTWITQDQWHLQSIGFAHVLPVQQTPATILLFTQIIYAWLRPPRSCQDSGSLLRARLVQIATDVHPYFDVVLNTTRHPALASDKAVYVKYISPYDTRTTPS